MKNVFTRFMALLLTLCMLLGMAACAEDVPMKTTHVVTNILGQIVDELLVETVDEDGCAHFEFSLSQNQAEMLKVFLQLGKAFTFGTDAENAITVTPEAYKELLALLKSVVPQAEPDPRAEQINMLLNAGMAYAQDGALDADMAALYGLLMNEVNRLAMIAAMTGCLQQNEEGEIRIELDDVALMNLAAAYLTSFAGDADVAAQVALLNIWKYLALSEEETAALIQQGLAAIGEAAAQLTEIAASWQSTGHFLAVINMNGLSVEFSAVMPGQTIAFALTYDGATIHCVTDTACEQPVNETVHVEVTANDQGTLVVVNTVEGDETTDVTVSVAETVSVNVVTGNGKGEVNDAACVVDPMNGVKFTLNYFENGEQKGLLDLADGREGFAVKYEDSSRENQYTNVEFAAGYEGAVLNVVHDHDDRHATAEATADASGFKAHAVIPLHGIVSTYDCVYDAAANTLTYDATEVRGEETLAVMHIRADETLVVSYDVHMDGFVLVLNIAEQAENKGVYEGTLEYSLNGIALDAKGALNTVTGDFSIEGNVAEGELTGSFSETKQGNAVQYHVIMTDGAITAEQTEVVDLDNLVFSYAITNTVGEETTTIMSFLGMPAITEKGFGYTVSAQTAPETGLNLNGTVTVGVNDLCVEENGSAHAELFVNVNGMEYALDATYSDTAIDLIAKLVGMPMAELLLENEMTADALIYSATLKVSEMIAQGLNQKAVVTLRDLTGEAEEAHGEVNVDLYDLNGEEAQMSLNAALEYILTKGDTSYALQLLGKMFGMPVAQADAEFALVSEDKVALTITTQVSEMIAQGLNKQAVLSITNLSDDMRYFNHGEFAFDLADVTVEGLQPLFNAALEFLFDQTETTQTIDLVGKMFGQSLIQMTSETVVSRDAYIISATTLVNEMIAQGASQKVVYGLRNLEPDAKDTIHGEAFYEQYDLNGEQPQMLISGAIEFLDKKFGPLNETAQLIAKLYGMPVVDLKAEETFDGATLALALTSKVAEFIAPDLSKKVIVGLRDLEPGQGAVTHGELFVEQYDVEDIGLKEIVNAALEFLYGKTDTTEKLELIGKMAGQVMASFLMEEEVSFVPAVPHIDGFAPNGQQLFEMIAPFLGIELYTNVTEAPAEAEEIPAA